MEVKNIIGYALKDEKVEWWFKLTWGDGHGGMWALKLGEEFKRYGLTGHNRTRIELEDYDIDFNFSNKKLNGGK